MNEIGGFSTLTRDIYYQIIDELIAEVQNDFLDNGLTQEAINQMKRVFLYLKIQLYLFNSNGFNV